MLAGFLDFLAGSVGASLAEDMTQLASSEEDALQDLKGCARRGRSGQTRPGDRGGRCHGPWIHGCVDDAELGRSGSRQPAAGGNTSLVGAPVRESLVFVFSLPTVASRPREGLEFVPSELVITNREGARYIRLKSSKYGQHGSVYVLSCKSCLMS